MRANDVLTVEDRLFLQEAKQVFFRRSEPELEKLPIDVVAEGVLGYNGNSAVAIYHEMVATGILWNMSAHIRLPLLHPSIWAEHSPELGAKLDEQEQRCRQFLLDINKQGKYLDQPIRCCLESGEDRSKYIDMQFSPLLWNAFHPAPLDKSFDQQNWRTNIFPVRFTTGEDGAWAEEHLRGKAAAYFSPIRPSQDSATPEGGNLIYEGDEQEYPGNANVVSITNDDLGPAMQRSYLVLRRSSTPEHLIRQASEAAIRSGNCLRGASVADCAVNGSDAGAGIAGDPGSTAREKVAAAADKRDRNKTYCDQGKPGERFAIGVEVGLLARNEAQCNIAATITLPYLESAAIGSVFAPCTGGQLLAIDADGSRRPATAADKVLRSVHQEAPVRSVVLPQKIIFPNRSGEKMDVDPPESDRSGTGVQNMTMSVVQRTFDPYSKEENPFIQQKALNEDLSWVNVMHPIDLQDWLHYPEVGVLRSVTAAIDSDSNNESLWHMIKFLFGFVDPCQVDLQKSTKDILRHYPVVEDKRCFGNDGDELGDPNMMFLLPFVGEQADDCPTVVLNKGEEAEERTLLTPRLFQYCSIEAILADLAHKSSPKDADPTENLAPVRRANGGAGPKHKQPDSPDGQPFVSKGPHYFTDDLEEPLRSKDVDDPTKSAFERSMIRHCADYAEEIETLNRLRTARFDPQRHAVEFPVRGAAFASSAMEDLCELDPENFSVDVDLDKAEEETLALRRSRKCAAYGEELKTRNERK